MKKTMKSTFPFRNLYTEVGYVNGKIPRGFILNPTELSNFSNHDTKGMQIHNRFITKSEKLTKRSDLNS